jgi:hypothetical protein
MISPRTFEPVTSGPLTSSPIVKRSVSPIRSALSVAEILCRPSENVCEIELRRGAEANAPWALAHAVLFDAPEMIFSERSRK